MSALAAADPLVQNRALARSVRSLFRGEKRGSRREQRTPFRQERRPTRILIVAAGLLAANAAAGQKWGKEPAAYRGLPMGASEQQVKEVIGKKPFCMDFRGTSAAKDADRGCLGSFVIGTVSVSEHWLFVHDHLVSVSWTFASTDYPKLKETFIEKYGQPTENRNDVVKTTMGVEYQRETLSWTGEKIYVTASNLGSKVTEGSAVFSDLGYYIQKAQADSDAQKKAKDSF